MRILDMFIVFLPVWPAFSSVYLRVWPTPLDLLDLAWLIGRALFCISRPETAAA